MKNVWFTNGVGAIYLNSHPVEHRFAHTMEHKTEQLREIFMEVADDATVTEQQQESPGTLTGEQPVDDRLDALIQQLRERYTFHTDLSTEEYRDLAREYYQDASDVSMASSFDIDPETVFAARLDLHLLRESDREGPVSISDLRKHIRQADGDANPADHFDADPDDLERLTRVAKTEIAMRQVNYRYRDAFNDILGDGDLAEHFTDEVTNDGLEDATEGMEVETSF